MSVPYIITLSENEDADLAKYVARHNTEDQTTLTPLQTLRIEVQRFFDDTVRRENKIARREALENGFQTADPATRQQVLDLLGVTTI